ncbi:MAG: DUF2971 domain-containing protein [Paludibacteraceae bacterium]|nr:DUF2971 domain-containing protein [Paludibacteraceae bacterium]
MNRIDYENILESIKIPEDCNQETIQSMLYPLNHAILQLMPSRLYKYRTCIDKHIDAFIKDEVWMSTSDLFNDPFDTLLQINEQEINESFAIFNDKDKLTSFLDSIAMGDKMPVVISEMLTDKSIIKEHVNDLLKDLHINENGLQELKLTTYIISKVLPTVIQHLSTTVCFSEDVNSILMWSHYSCNHTGFALGYDLSHFLSPNTNNIGLFPMIYSPNRYNATNFFYYWFGKLFNLPLKNQDILSSIKIQLYKAKEWEYEKEWRLIKSRYEDVFNSHSEPQIIRPNSIYYGCHISKENQEKLHEIAKGKNLQEYKMRIENAATTYQVSAQRIL